MCVERRLKGKADGALEVDVVQEEADADMVERVKEKTKQKVEVAQADIGEKVKSVK